jgi:membrane protein
VDDSTNLIDRIRRQPLVAHLLRAVDRFGARLGNQFAAAITYFSVLAIVPIAMFAFAILGWTIEVLRPDLLGTVTTAIANQLQSASGAEEIVKVLVDFLKNWRGVGMVAILSGAYAGAGWVGNLRQAVNAMSGPRFTVVTPKGGPLGMVLMVLRNLAVLLGLLVFGALTIAVSLAATAARKTVLSWVGLGDSFAAAVLAFVVGLLISVGAGWLLFMFLYRALMHPRPTSTMAGRGAMFGSIGLVALQYLAGVLNGVFAHNKAAAIFGSAIVAILALNLFATLVMVGAAWTATGQNLEKEAVIAGEPDARMLPLAENPLVTGETLVSRKVASRGVTVGLATGYVLGGAAGIGFGAVVGRIAGAIARRRRR